MTTSPAQAEAADQLRGSQVYKTLGRRGSVTYDLRVGSSNLWVAAREGAVPLVALRCGFGGEIEGAPDHATQDGAHIVSWRTKLGAVRLKIRFPRTSERAIRCITSFLPALDLHVSSSVRDLFSFEDLSATVHTFQRGLRSGVLFATCARPSDLAVFYFQDFSSLGEFFEVTHTSPAGTVGGTLIEGGYLMPAGDGTVLPKAREIIISDVFLTVIAQAAIAPDDVPGLYLDLLADTYAGLELPATQYHDWPLRASRTLRDLTLSPKSLYARDGARYLRPYVGDDSKPPESMVQLTLLVNLLEYDGWRGAPSTLSSLLLRVIDRFYDPAIESVVRWLPGESFGDQTEENMNHESMDTWYLYHALFNLSRLATMGNVPAREMLQKSLLFAMRVAHRFDYRWPVFFNLKTLEIVRAEASPGKGGENDVAGLYALLMLHAHTLFGDDAYLAEARCAAETLRNLGFTLGYQMNTTGFAAEAMLRLWNLTHDPRYMRLSELCMANIFDNMWLWRCEYGRAKHYRTFFGLFPLHDAPYLAAYEELEAQAKFHEYLRLGADAVRPSLRFLLAEYQKYNLDRGAYYYPDALPVDVVSANARNGSIERALSVPLEDLHDGWSPSGSVGQELYGSGLALICTTRHYRVVPSANAFVFCNYPLLEFRSGVSRGKTLSLKTGGDARGTCELRIIPLDPGVEVGTAKARLSGASRELERTISVEGHQVFQLRGDSRYAVQLARVARPRSKKR